MSAAAEMASACSRMADVANVSTIFLLTSIVCPKFKGDLIIGMFAKYFSAFISLLLKCYRYLHVISCIIFCHPDSPWVVMLE